MPRSAGANVAILARVDLLQLSAALRIVVRDPIVVLAALGLAAAVVVGAGRLALAWRGDPHAAFLVVAAASFLAFSLACAALRAGLAEAVASSPFGDLLLSPGVQASLPVVRAAACQLPVIVLAVLGAIVAGLATAAAMLAAALAGASLAATTHFFTSLLRPLPSRVRRRARQPDTAAAPSIVIAPAVVLVAWAHLRRRVGGAPSYLVAVGFWTLAALAGGLALRNSGIGAGVAVVLALSAPGLAPLAQTDVALIQTLGHEPIGLARLLGRFAGVAAAGAAGSTAAALAAGLGIGPSLGLGAGCGLGLGLFTLFLALHALVDSRAVARTAASVDFVASVGLPLLTPWGAVWPLLRLPLLLGAARRRRWLDA